jgi:hypothetical protein
VGDILRLAQLRAIAPGKDRLDKDQLRTTLDGMAEILSPAPVDLATERREHVLMYQLIGDPLLRLHRPTSEVAQRTTAIDRVK